MTKEDEKRIAKVEEDIVNITKTLETTLKNQERFAVALENILDYMEEHRMTVQYRPNKLDS